MKRQSRREAQLFAEAINWKRRFAALVKFQRTHGHCLVPPKKPGNPRLCDWVGKQRAMWRSGRLQSERFRRLQRLGFAWDYKEGLWERRFLELQAFRLLHGHCQVPSCSKTNPSLGNWVHFQRVQKRRGRLRIERARRLDQIGFDWVSRGRSLEYRDSTYWEVNWKRMLPELAKFKQRFGHTWVPSGPPGSPQLSRWVSRQRRLKQQGQLRQNRRRQLDALGFDWRGAAAVGSRWERCFLRLLEFKRRFGHSHVPAEWKENITLGRWVVKTRHQKLVGILSAEKVSRLSGIGFVWDAIGKNKVEHDTLWSKWLARLIAFHRKHGHWCVPTDQPKYHQLRVWMDNQRINYQRGWLSTDRIRIMEKARFPWLSDRARALAAKARKRATKAPSKSAARHRK